MRMQERAYKAKDVVGFLRLLLCKIPGKLLVIWDGASIHHAKEVKDFLRARGCQTAASGTLAWLCPRTQSPRRGLESAQGRELKNLCCRDVAHVADELRHAKERLRHRQAVLQQCFAHAGCPV